ncbi:888_t:CDS:2 [Entrophospora sp. SA101]|nr:888_t:CDS:2 [Entrophospora sp. SA101]
MYGIGAELSKKNPGEFRVDFVISAVDDYENLYENKQRQLQQTLDTSLSLLKLKKLQFTI